jgi:type I restriction enzyme S subunit
LTLIPLPPLEEQLRIVSVLESVDKVSTLEQQKKFLNEKYSKILKSSFLKSAMNGELTQQLSTDSSVKELVKDIAKEKECLIKVDKIKKGKPLSLIKDDEMPFDIPCTWKWVRLGDLCTKIVDGDHNPPKGEVNETEFLMGSSLNINNNNLVKLGIGSLRYLSKNVFKKINERTKVENGDILFTSVGTLGRSCIFNKDINITFQRSVTIISTRINNKFLKCSFDSPYVQNFVFRNASGTAQKGFYLSQMKNLIIAVPPLEEQQRIVDKLDKVFAMCDNMIEK